MKTLLISSNNCVDPYPVYPLGMGVVARAFENCSWQVTQADILVHGLSGIQELLESETYDLIGISIRNIDTVNSAEPHSDMIKIPLEIIKLCRKFSEAPVMLGGAGFSLMPEAIMACSGADFGIVGEGEVSIMQTAAMIERGETPPRLICNRTVEQLPASYDETLLRFYYERTHIISMQTKRGCPFNCVYCTYPALEGNRIRQRPYDEIIDQIEKYHQLYPEAMFFFVDSIFNDPGEEYKRFLQAMFKRCGAVPFCCFITPDNLSDADIDFMVSCGLVMADVGVDATSDVTLKGMGKNFTFAQAHHCVHTLLDRGVGVSCSCMVCGPDENYETLKEGIENLKTLEPAGVGLFSGVRVLPGTVMYDIAKARGMVPADWDGVSSLFFFEEGMEQDKVHEILTEAFKENRFVIYPPDRANRTLRTIHKIGYLNYRKFMRGTED